MIGKPVIGISCCTRFLSTRSREVSAHHTVYHRYVDFIFREVGAIPVLLPAVPENADEDHTPRQLLSMIDGLLLPGAPSNVGMRWRNKDGLVEIAAVGEVDHGR